MHLACWVSAGIADGTFGEGMVVIDLFGRQWVWKSKTDRLKKSLSVPADKAMVVMITVAFLPADLSWSPAGDHQSAEKPHQKRRRSKHHPGMAVAISGLNTSPHP